jgi:hypothetical protein
LQSQKSSNPGPTNLIFQGQRVDASLQPVSDQLEKIKEHGEAALLDDDAVRHRINTDRIMKLLMYISAEHIRENYNKAGIYASDGGKEANVRSINIAVKGPSRYQEVVNYWGNVNQGDNVFLILTRRKNAQRSTAENPVYEDFHWVPWSGAEIYPPSNFYTYYDDAGIIQQGIVYYIGNVNYKPDTYNDPELCQILLGNSGTSLEAYQKSEFTKKVQLNLGIPRHRLEIYSF